MNKKELIEKYKELENGTFDIAAIVVCQSLLKDLEQLDESQKVKVPQFVAEHIEEDFHLLGAMNRENFDKKLEDWFYTDDNMDLFARAWLDGYEVEKEKRYLVKVKGLNEDNSYLNYDSIDDEWYFTDAENGPAVGTHHTRKQLEEAGFGWVFDCEGVEVEEVEG